MLPSAPPSAAAPGIPVFWSMLGRIVYKLIGEHAHASVVIMIKDGKVQHVRVDQSFLPEGLPRV